MSEIAKWFGNKSVFVTGATGFVGKCLVVKLLRDCPDIAGVYIIIRPKKGVSFEQRKSEYKNHVVFGVLDAIAIDKIHIFEGDICEKNIGLAAADHKFIRENASVILHSAADVRFDRKLIDAYQTNVVGSKNMLEFASEFKHLLAFVLVSTAFSQTTEVEELEEKHYKSKLTPEFVEQVVNSVDEDALEALTPKLLDKYPNTYGFTKGLVEQLVYDYSEKFPTAIARPPIIITSWKEPLTGYTEGIHGVNGWVMASGRGILRSMMCRNDYPCNVMPADIVTNGIIVLAYERGRRHEQSLLEKQVNDESSQQGSVVFEEPMYFNITEESPMLWGTYRATMIPQYLRYPFDIGLWYPGGSFKENRLHHNLCVFFKQIIPAILVDFLLILFRYPPFLVKVQRIISASCSTLEYYMNNKFVFKADKYLTACGRLNEHDRKIFYDRSTMTMSDYYTSASFGNRLYLGKEKVEDIPKARAFFNRLKYLDKFTQGLFAYWIVRMTMNYFNFSLY